MYSRLNICLANLFNFMKPRYAWFHRPGLKG